MLKQPALEFGRAMADLGRLEIICVDLRRRHPDILTDDSGHLRKVSMDMTGNLRRICILTNLEDLLPQIDRFDALIRTPEDPKIEDVKAAAEYMRHRLHDVLKNEFFLQVDRDEVRFYNQSAPFGPKVASKFKGAAADITNAGNCIALRQPDACVFHLMRAMEVAVRRLSTRIGLTITPKTTWRQLTGVMDGKIKAMPNATFKQKEKQNDWEAARANLHQVGSVWRNATMHPATSYTRGQARDVHEAVRVFMTSLADL